MRFRAIAVLSATVGLAGCSAFGDALTAHVDVTARVEGQELTVTRLSDLLGNSSLGIPVNREIAVIINNLWVSYQLAGVAAARHDTLSDPKAIETAMRAITGNMRLRQFMQRVAGTLRQDSASEATYNQASGNVFVARHILFALPGGATQEQKDSVRRVAEGVRGRVTGANFADLAKRHSNDPGSAQRGGDLGAFPRGDMVKPFGDAVAALRPGEISPLVETSFGYHIIQRPTYTSAKAQYDPAFSQLSSQRAESIFVAKIDDDARINVRSSAPAAAKTAARDLSGHRTDDDVLATFKGGELTVGHFVNWVESYPPQMRLPQQVAQAADSIARQIVKSIARQEVMLLKADSAGIVLTADEKKQLADEFKMALFTAWQQLGLEPASLDSAKSVPERERLAASRVEAFLDRVMTGQAQPITVPPPVQSVLMSKYQWKTFPAGIDRSVERAKKLRATADSARQIAQPRSQVPLPTPPANPQRDTATKRP